MLTREQKQQFDRNGFVVLDGAIDAKVVGEARNAVWEAIDEDPDDPASWPHDNRSVDQSKIDDLRPFRELNDIAAAYCRSLVGEGNLTYEGDEQVQLALRFPREEQLNDPNAPQLSDVSSHVDGTLDVEDGEGRVVPHTINSCIYLDYVQPYGGGFTAWPGSHHDVCRYLEDHPIQSVQGGIAAPDGEGGWHEDISRSDVFDPIELAGSPGTITIWHGRLEHEGGINLSPGNVRMSAIKRFFHVNAGEYQEEAPEDPYRGWTGLPLD